MPTVYPLQIFPVTVRAHYPNMAPRDAAVWTRFVAAYADRFEGVAYDVALGGVRLTLPGDTVEDQTAWQYKTALRIDACLFSGREVLITEVKPEAQAGALGAALAYALVAEREKAFDKPVRAAIVCEYIQPDILWCCQQLAIEIFKV